MQNSKSTLRLIASVIFFIVGVVALWARSLSSITSIGYLFGNGFMQDIFSIHFISASLLIFPATIALGVIGVLQGRDKLLFWGSIGVWVWCVPLIWLSTIGANGLAVLIDYPVDVLIGSQLTDQIVTIGLTAATGLVILANQQPQAEPVQGQTPVVVEQGQAVESPMPILALVGALVFPIIGIVLGHMSLSQMKAGTMSSRQRGIAQAGLFIGYVITAITVFLLIWFVVALLTWQPTYY